MQGWTATPCKAEQPLEDMDLQEKEAQKNKAYRTGNLFKKNLQLIVSEEMCEERNCWHRHPYTSKITAIILWPKQKFFFFFPKVSSLPPLFNVGEVKKAGANAQPCNI